MEPDLLYIIIAAVASAVVAFLVTYLVANSTIKKLRLSLNHKDSDLKAQEMLLQERQSMYERNISQMEKAQEKTIKELKESSEKSLQMQVSALKNEFIVTTEKLLKQRQDELSEKNKSGMDEILTPLRNSIEDMKKALTDNEKENIKSTTDLKSALEQAIQTMGQKTADIGAKADNLSEALTGRPKVQGCWGENFLDDILSREGLEKGLHYDREVSGEDKSRPDFVFHFMDGMDKKDLVVDSKVSLTAYVDYVNARDENQRQEALSRHIKSIRKHVDELSSKDYASKVDKNKRFADYVLMFMPIDMAYRAAIDADSTLWKYAYDKKVLITTEQTIMPFLMIIRLTWNKYAQDSNILEMMQAAEMVVERVGQFYEQYEILGKKIGDTCKAYNAGIGKLKDGGPSITTSAKQLIRLGAKRKKGKDFQIPSSEYYLGEEEE